jgi:hypothetical protein
MKQTLNNYKIYAILISIKSILDHVSSFFGKQHKLFVMHIGNSVVIMVTNVWIDIINAMDGTIALMVVMNGIVVFIVRLIMVEK